MGSKEAATANPAIHRVMSCYHEYGVLGFLGNTMGTRLGIVKDFGSDVNL